jgi:hypothetical protein
MQRKLNENKFQEKGYSRRNFLKASSLAAIALFSSHFLEGCTNFIEDLADLNTVPLASEKFKVGEEKHIYRYDIKFKVFDIYPVAQFFCYDLDIIIHGPLAIIKNTLAPATFEFYRANLKTDIDCGIITSDRAFYRFTNVWIAKDSLKIDKNKLPYLYLGYLISEADVKAYIQRGVFPPFHHFEVFCKEIFYDSKKPSNSYVILDFYEKFL